MNKYFYYNYFTVAFTNLLVFVPYVLIQNRYNGSVLALLIGFIIGMLLLYLFTSVTSKYPNKDVIQIMSEAKQNWFIYIFVSLKTIISIISSILVVGGYAVIVSRYLNPDTDLKMVIILVLLATGYAATRNLLSVAYLIEFMMIITIPFIVFIMYKTFTNPIFTWDSVRAVAQHYQKIPNLLTIASATFFFSGFSHLTLFVNQKNKPLKFKNSWLAPIITFVIALITIIVPIGMLGTETSAQYLFVWTVAADATEIPYGFIERLMFVFIIVLLSIAITYTVSTLSQVIDASKQTLLLFSKKMTPKRVNRLPIYIYSVLAIVIFICVLFNNDFLFEIVAKWYLIIHFLAELLFTTLLFIIMKWKGASHDSSSS